MRGNFFTGTRGDLIREEAGLMTESPSSHDPLKILGTRWFETFEASHVVTFLNQLLAERGLAFGVRLRDGGQELAVYDTGPRRHPA
jgi:hypothetical protein